MNQTTLIVTAIGALLALVFAVYLTRQVIRAGPMASFSRLCLLTACGAWLALAAAAVIAALFAAPWLVVAAVLTLLYFGRGTFSGSGWSHGTARWADATDLIRVGMLDPPEGLILGKISPPPFKVALRLLRRMPWRDSEKACRLFFAALRRRGQWVRWNNGVHAAVFAPTGAGKGVSFVIPALLTEKCSVVCVDPKGENALRTAAYRRDVLGQKVVILDPFRIMTDTPDTYNPLAGISPDAPTWIDDLRATAEALIIRTGEEKEPHWLDSALLFLWAMMVFVVMHRKPAMQNLQIVAELLADPKRLEEATARLCENPDPLIARLGGQLRHFIDRERGSVLTTANRCINFLCTPALMESTLASSFDEMELKQQMTVYLVLPTQYLRTQAPLLRVWISSLLRSVVRAGAGEESKVLFLLDEAGALGKLDVLDDALYQLRGFGVRLMYFYQNIGQLKRCYPEDEGQGLLANTDMQVFMAVNDMQTAELVSSRCGSATIQTVSGNWGTSRTNSYDTSNGMPSGSTGTNSGGGVQEAGRELLKKEEVALLGERTAVVFIRGMPPLLTRLVRYYEPEFRSVRPSASNVWLAVRCFAFAAASVIGATLVASTAVKELSAIQQRSPVTVPAAPKSQPKTEPKQIKR